MPNKTYPKLRFKEFTDEWQEKKLGDVAELTSSKRVYLTDYVSSGIPFYRGKEISELKKNIIPSDILFISEKAYSQFKEKYGIPREGDILITAVGTLGNVMRIKNNVPFYFKDGNLIWLRKVKESAQFLEILLEKGKSKVLKSSIGSSQQALTIIGLNKLKFSFPSEHEQEKIAGFLTVVDEKIGKLEEKKKEFEKYKKGVMQAIFSQKIRFKYENGEIYPNWKEKKLGDMLEHVVDNRGKTPPIVKAGIPLIEVNALGDRQVKYNSVLKYVSDDVHREWFRKHITGDEVLFSTVGQTALCSIYDGTAKATIAQNIVALKTNRKHSGHFLYYLLTEKRNNHKFIKIEMGAVQPSVKVSQMIHLKFNVPEFEEQEKIAGVLTSLDNKVELICKELEQARLFKKSLLQQMFV